MMIDDLSTNSINKLDTNFANWKITFDFRRYIPLCATRVRRNLHLNVDVVVKREWRISGVAGEREKGERKM